VEQRIDDFTVLWNDAGFIKSKDEELSPGRLKLLLWAGENFSYAQHLRGIKYLIRNSQYMPNGAQYQAAVLGVPVESLTTSKAVDHDAIEVNGLWDFMIKWWRRLVEGHRFELTIVQAGKPVLHKFTDRSLVHGLRPYVVHHPYEPQFSKLECPESPLPLALAKLDAWERNHYAGWDAGDLRVEQRRKELQDAVEAAKANNERLKRKAKANFERAKAQARIADADRLYCRIRVEMPPRMPPLLVKLHEQYGTVGTGIQEFAKFMALYDEYFRGKFQKKGLELIAARAKEASHLSPSRQLSGAMQFDAEPRVFRGVIRLHLDGNTTYYAAEALRAAKANGAPIDEDDIQHQAAFVENVTEIWDAPYPPPAPPPPPPPTVSLGWRPSIEAKAATVKHGLISRSIEQELADCFLPRLEREAQLEAMRDAGQHRHEKAAEIERWRAARDAAALASEKNNSLE
jgi:hypothetical protein